MRNGPTRTLQHSGTQLCGWRFLRQGFVLSPPRIRGAKQTSKESGRSGKNELVLAGNSRDEEVRAVPRVTDIVTTVRISDLRRRGQNSTKQKRKSRSAPLMWQPAEQPVLFASDSQTDRR